jgi:S1-C subfamily serine protease
MIGVAACIALVALLLLPVLGWAAPMPQPMVLGIAARPNFGGGMLVTAVYDGMPAAQMGLMPGDVILTVNGQFVNSHEDMRAAVDALTDHVTLVLARPDGTFVQVDADISHVYGGPPRIHNVHRTPVRRPR